MRTLSSLSIAATRSATPDKNLSQKPASSAMAASRWAERSCAKSGMQSAAVARAGSAAIRCDRLPLTVPPEGTRQATAGCRASLGVARAPEAPRQSPEESRHSLHTPRRRRHLYDHEGQSHLDADHTDEIARQFCAGFRGYDRVGPCRACGDLAKDIAGDDAARVIYQKRAVGIAIGRHQRAQSESASASTRMKLSDRHTANTVAPSPVRACQSRSRLTALCDHKPMRQPSSAARPKAVT